MKDYCPQRIHKEHTEWKLSYTVAEVTQKNQSRGSFTYIEKNEFQAILERCKLSE